MDRQLLSKILTVMKNYLKEGKSIGDLKVSSLLALGHQLEAIFYYLGHELGTIISVKQVKDVSDIPEALKKIVAEYNIGDITITESTNEIIQLKLQGHSSIKDLLNKGIKTKGSFSSFEAGMLAGIVEKMTNIHCFAQELSSALEMGKDYCEFMIVFQKD
ncbi:MAG: DUF2507 domain-containing protein [Promethearchaeota archaeon]